MSRPVTPPVRRWAGRPVPELAGRPVLVVRADRLGDVLLALPVLPELRQRLAGSRLAFLASAAVAPLLAEHPWIDELIVDERDGRHRGAAGFLALAAELRRRRFAAALLLRPTLRHAALLAAARIPCRVGTAFRAYSWLFTHRVFAHRRGAGRHELELNLDLLAPLGGHPEWPGRPRLPWVPVVAAARSAARALTGGAGRFVVLHPGSGGSAREWPPDHFATLGQALAGLGIAVVVTGTAAEAALARRVAEAVPGSRDLAGRTSLPELAAVLADAQAVVAASTGTLHLAAAVGTPVAGIYPPIRGASPVRWGPRAEAAAVLVPDAPPCPRCIGARCPYWDCMAAVTPGAVLARLAPWIGTPAVAGIAPAAPPGR